MIIKYFLFILLSYLIFCEVLIYFFSRPKRLSQFDFILVLGNRGGVDSPVKKDRARNAILAKKKFPSAQIILTGNEKKYSEVTNLKTLISQEGICEFIEEKESIDTWDNMTLSYKKMKEILITREPHVLIVTSQYHQGRGLAMARSVGMQADAFGKDSEKYKDALFHFFKERFSNMLYTPQIIFHFLIGY